MNDRRIKHKEVLKAVLGVLEDQDVMAEIWSDYDKFEESKNEYVRNRKERILRVLEIAGVDPESYMDAVQEQTRSGVNIILARDIDEMYINNYNPEWIFAWGGNMDLSVCLDFFAVITYITDYFTKDESGTSGLLKMAAKHTSEMKEPDQKRHLKNVFLANRQMGISEAFMKLLPENRLKDSSIGTEFIPHGKKEDISRFVVRADQNNIDEESTFSKLLFEIPGREGLYYEKPNWLEKFFRRGKRLLDVCPIQYVKMFDVDSKGGKIPTHEEDCDFVDSVERFGKEAKFHHVVLSNGLPGKILPECAELDDPLPGEPRFMRKRKHPKAIRYFKVKLENDPARFFLQELMFYTIYDEETYNLWHDDEVCTAAYMAKREEIEARKRVLMEWLDPVEEARYFVEESMKNELNLDEVETRMDAEKQQADLDCEEEGIEPDPQYEHLDLGDHNEHEFLPSTNWCRKIDVKEEKLYEDAASLDMNQRKVLDICLKYARDVVKSRSNGNTAPIPPRLIVVGGAGAGKSTVIQTVIQWSQKILQRSGDEPQRPYILATATTGAASVIIEGMTLHTAVGLDFSNKHSSLTDKKRELKRDQCKNLKLIIVDEFSMMKSDQLYQVDLRLRELKQNNREYGGVAVLLFGDPAQLRQ